MFGTTNLTTHWWVDIPYAVEDNQCTWEAIQRCANKCLARAHTRTHATFGYRSALAFVVFWSPAPPQDNMHNSRRSELQTCMRGYGGVPPSATCCGAYPSSEGSRAQKRKFMDSSDLYPCNAAARLSQHAGGSVTEIDELRPYGHQRSCEAHGSI